jgi:hypothetical protein
MSSRPKRCCDSRSEMVVKNIIPHSPFAHYVIALRAASSPLIVQANVALRAHNNKRSKHRITNITLTGFNLQQPTSIEYI